MDAPDACGSQRRSQSTETPHLGPLLLNDSYCSIPGTGRPDDVLDWDDQMQVPRDSSDGSGQMGSPFHKSLHVAYDDGDVARKNRFPVLKLLRHA